MPSDPLDAALEIIAQVGVVYNMLERDDQKELLRQMIERVIVDPTGKAKLELRTPFAYLKDISDKVRSKSAVSGVKGVRKTKTSAQNIAGLGTPECSDWVLSCWGDRIRTYECRIQSPEPYRLATPQ